MSVSPSMRNAASDARKFMPSKFGSPVVSDTSTGKSSRAIFPIRSCAMRPRFMVAVPFAVSTTTGNPRASTSMPALVASACDKDVVVATRRNGSLAVGKDADFQVTRGDPLDPRHPPELVYIEGTLVHRLGDVR